jgi:hypothetical protein
VGESASPTAETDESGAKTQSPLATTRTRRGTRSTRHSLPLSQLAENQVTRRPPVDPRAESVVPSGISSGTNNPHVSRGLRADPPPEPPKALAGSHGQKAEAADDLLET